MIRKPYISKDVKDAAFDIWKLEIEMIAGSNNNQKIVPKNHADFYQELLKKKKELEEIQKRQKLGLEEDLQYSKLHNEEENEEENGMSM